MMQQLVNEQEQMARDIFTPMPAFAPMPPFHPMSPAAGAPAIARNNRGSMRPLAIAAASALTQSLESHQEIHRRSHQLLPHRRFQPMTEIWWMKLDQLWYGGVKVDAADQQKRCVYRPASGISRRSTASGN